MPPPRFNIGLPKGYAHIVVQVTNLRKNMATLHANAVGGGVSLAYAHNKYFCDFLICRQPINDNKP